MQVLSMESNVSAPKRLNPALSKSQKLIARSRVPEIVCLISLNVSQRTDYPYRQPTRNVETVIA